MIKKDALIARRTLKPFLDFIKVRELGVGVHLRVKLFKVDVLKVDLTQLFRRDGGAGRAFRTAKSLA